MVLLYAQLGFYATIRKSVTLIFEQFDFDLVLVSPDYVFLRFPGSISLNQLQRARRDCGVETTTPLYISNVRTRVGTKRFETVVIGIDPATRPFQRDELNAVVPGLRKLDCAMFDEVTTGSYVPRISEGSEVELDEHRVKVASTYRNGTGMAVDSQMIVGVQTVARITPAFSKSSVTLGLVKLRYGVDMDAAQERLQALLGDNIQVFHREELLDHERSFFLSVKPTGIQFGLGVVLAIIVFAAMSYQLLAINTARRVKEYSTMLALGYTAHQVRTSLIVESLFYQIVALFPATAIAALLYQAIRQQTNLPIELTVLRTTFVTAFSIVVGIVTSYFVTRIALRSDPADLY